MSYNPDAMTIIVSGDMPPEMQTEVKNQIAADVITAQEFAEREQALQMQEQVSEDTKQNRIDAGLEEDNEGDGFSAPDEGEIDQVDVADTSEDGGDGLGADEGLSTGGEGDTNEEDATGNEVDGEGNAETDPDATDSTNTENEDDGENNGTETEEASVDEEDLEEITDEDQEVTDELNEPNAAMEHAQSLGPKEIGIYLRLGTDKYRRRVRRKKKEQELKLAQETLQMDDAQRQKLIRRLLYVKPAQNGYDSKLQNFISTIDNPDEWIALVDTQGNAGSEDDLSTKQIQAALQKAGIQMFENVETLADTFNQVQKAITEPSQSQEDISGDEW